VVIVASIYLRFCIDRSQSRYILPSDSDSTAVLVTNYSSVSIKILYIINKLLLIAWSLLNSAALKLMSSEQCLFLRGSVLCNLILPLGMLFWYTGGLLAIGLNFLCWSLINGEERLAIVNLALVLKLYVITQTCSQVTNNRILVKDISYNPTCFGALRHHDQGKNTKTLSDKTLDGWVQLWLK
jgi:hypothetical protein